MGQNLMNEEAREPLQASPDPAHETESPAAAAYTAADPAPVANEEAPAVEVAAAALPLATQSLETEAPEAEMPQEEATETGAPVSAVLEASSVEPPVEVGESIEEVAPVAAAAVEAAEKATEKAAPDSVPSVIHTPGDEPEYPRFRLMARIEHMTLLVSFTILCLTGLPQKFPFSPLSQWMIGLFGGIEMTRSIHRWAAVALILGSIYHLLTSSYRLFVKHEDMRMLPDLKDGFDLRDTVAYNLGFTDEPPKMRKFNFGEKFEYWAVVWGTGVMIFTGFILWNPIAATRFMPGSYIPVAVLAHGWEAVLAAVSIVIWHLYNVLGKHRNVSMFTGTLSHKIMEEEHALELERLEAGGDPWKVISPEILARRRKIFLAVASVVVILAVALVAWMFTFEDTAIIVPQATRDIFVPLATPIP